MKRTRNHDCRESFRMRIRILRSFLFFVTYASPSSLVHRIHESPRRMCMAIAISRRPGVCQLRDMGNLATAAVPQAPIDDKECRVSCPVHQREAIEKALLKSPAFSPPPERLLDEDVASTAERKMDAPSLITLVGSLPTSAIADWPKPLNPPPPPGAQRSLNNHASSLLHAWPLACSSGRHRQLRSLARSKVGRCGERRISSVLEKRCMTRCRIVFPTVIPLRSRGPGTKEQTQFCSQRLAQSLRCDREVVCIVRRSDG